MQIIYRLADDEVIRGDLLRLVRRGKAVVIDVRPPEEYAAGHIPHCGGGQARGAPGEHQ